MIDSTNLPRTAQSQGLEQLIAILNFLPRLNCLAPVEVLAGLKVFHIREMRPGKQLMAGKCWQVYFAPANNLVNAHSPARAGDLDLEFRYLNQFSLHSLGD